ncbi:MAG: chemotaxis protein CheW [Acidobacteria bacterium]|nr:chemotaxis protein CheW [Acidobacteriota bacterium]
MQRQLIQDLVIESLEGLDSFDAEMLALEGSDGKAQDHLKLAFRMMHTVKGSSGCLGFETIEKVAHSGENLLSLLRDEVIPVSQPVISGLLRCSDALRDMVHCLEVGAAPETIPHSDLLQLLDSLQRADANDPVAGPTSPATSASSQAQPGWGLFEEEPLPSAIPAAVSSESIPEELPVAVQNLSSADNANENPGEEIPGKLGPNNATGAPRASESAIRVEVAQIDRLMNLVGELVLARNRILQLTGAMSDPALNGPVQRVNLITTELQASVMKTRMQTVQTVWSKFPRLVRDLSHDLGKKVVLTMEGQDTELDRTVIEAIRDPLTHIVRNSIDHGLELPAARLASNKNETGQLRLTAFHEGGQVVLEIADDGRGIDPARVSKKAIERGLISADDAARLSEREILNLIFQAGFSTAEKVTNLSGRGVGMDVVRSNVEKIGGTVEINSSVGEGTTIQIRIPLTLAIIPALLVGCGGNRFAIPQASLLELVRLDPSNSTRSIEWVDAAPVLRLRGKLLALLDLGQALGLRSQPPAEDAFVVVVEAGGRKFGVLVDSVLDTEEIVVKPLHRLLKSLGVYAGATILGDGQVALILDIAGLAKRNGMSATRKLVEAESTQGQTVVDDGAKSLRLLMTRVAQNRVAFPLEEVTRIEEIPANSVERSGPREVLQYRGRIMPLVRIGDCLGELRSTHPPDLIHVVVCQLRGTQAGLIIDQIEDIFEERVKIERFGNERCVAGSLVAGGKIADLLDLERIAEFAGFERRP